MVDPGQPLASGVQGIASNILRGCR
jgi:hypothetical protein